MWYIIICPYCNLLQTVRADERYHTCYKCGKTLKLDYKKIRILYKSSNLKDVNWVLLRLKEKQFKGELKL
jgi:hypothetical protein